MPLDTLKVIARGERVALEYYNMNHPHPMHLLYINIYESTTQPLVEQDTIKMNSLLRDGCRSKQNETQLTLFPP